MKKQKWNIFHIGLKTVKFLRRVCRSFLRMPSSIEKSRLNKYSPNCITAQFTECVSEVDKLTLLPLTHISLSIVFYELVYNGLWSTSFETGCTLFKNNRQSTVRYLATSHLKCPTTDGWGVVAGAVELANAWAIRSFDLQHGPVGPGFEFARITRLRLAVCLCMSFKFARQFATHFPRRFHDRSPSLISPHTRELAHIGFVCMTVGEQEAFGGWNTGNSNAIQCLYDQMLEMEVDVLKTVNVFKLFAENSQSLAENRLAELFDDCYLTDEASMATRAHIPFFRIASYDGEMPPPTPGALIVAALSSVPLAHAFLYYEKEAFCRLFSQEERREGWRLVHSAISMTGLAADAARMGCFHRNAFLSKVSLELGAGLIYATF